MCEKLVLTRNFLYKFFVVGFLLFLLTAIIYIFVRGFAVEMALAWYGVDPLYYQNLVFMFFGFIKFILIFLVLSPALALHWMICCCKKKQS